MKSQIKLLAYVAATAALLSACGTSEPDRTGGGAATGAAAGAAIGAVFGGVGALPGAAIGALVGAGTGAATTPEQVDLGKPVWDRTGNQNEGVASAAPPPSSTHASSYGSTGAPSASTGQGGGPSIALAGDDIRTAQRKLRREGYYHGPVDGLYGPKTHDALLAYQRDNGLRQSAQLDTETMDRLNNDHGEHHANRRHHHDQAAMRTDQSSSQTRSIPSEHQPTASNDQSRSTTASTTERQPSASNDQSTMRNDPSSANTGATDTHNDATTNSGSSR